MNQENEILDSNLIKNNVSLIYENASVIRRYCNGIIDAFIIFLFYFITIACIVIILPSLTYEAGAGIFFIDIVLYYFIFEYLYKGRTIGKIVTKTKVIDKEGNSPTSKQVLIRIFARFMPFEYFTILTREDNTALHDGASGTRVIKILKK
jgi:uncharacterized RDD family membrane protein YckC